jgi:ParB family chromosome partitioning protein
MFFRDSIPQAPAPPVQQDIQIAAGDGTITEAANPVTAAGLCLDAEERKIPLADIDFDPANAVKHSDASTRRLADSIAAHGLLNPPTVYRDPETGRYCPVAGEGRIRALRLLGWQTTRARVLKAKPDPQRTRDLSLIDDLLREELDPLAFGIRCRDEIQRGRSARELAKILQNKYSASTITKHAALADKLPEDLHALIRNGDLPPAVARVLTGLPTPDEKRRWARMYTDRQVQTGEELAQAIRAAKHGNGHIAAPGNFTVQEAGVKITVSLLGQDLAAVETALKQFAKDVREHGHNLDHFRRFLQKKARASKKAAELHQAQLAVNAHGASASLNPKEEVCHVTATDDDVSGATANRGGEAVANLKP